MINEVREEEFTAFSMQMGQVVFEHAEILSPKEIIFLLLTHACHTAFLNKMGNTNIRDVLQEYLDEAIIAAIGIIDLAKKTGDEV